MTSRVWMRSSLLLLAIVGTGVGVAASKRSSLRAEEAAAASQPEPVESVTAAVATEREYRGTTTSIGTVLALRSVTLRNELAGTIRQVRLEPGQVVEAGTLLIALDVSVEEAELREQEARAALAQTLLGRLQSVSQNRATSKVELDRAQAELDVALAQVARTRAVIGRKTIRAPFRARVGLSDVHPGQYLGEGTELTTLQGVDEAAHVDFAVAQQVAAGLRRGDRVDIFAAGRESPLEARIVAIDARIDLTTRNAMVRARVEKSAGAPAPGSSVRVRVQVGEALTALAVPASALRKGPGGDHVFVIAPDQEGKTRVHMRKVTGGTVLGDEVLILAGLSAGEQVAASGSFKLREEGLVAIASSTEAATKGTK